MDQITSSGDDKIQQHRLYKEWMSLEEQEVSELQQFLNKRSSSNTSHINDYDDEADQVNVLLERTTQNFQDYIDKRRLLASHDACAFFSPRWCSALENSMLWIGGCRPSSYFTLTYALCGSDIESRLSQFLQDGNSKLSQLSASQLCEIDKLQRKTLVEEERLTSLMASLQQDKADTPLALIAHAHKSSCPRVDELNDCQVTIVRETIDKIEEGMASVMEGADLLRLNTYKELTKILKPVQALEYVVAAKKLRLCIQSCGLERDRKHGRE